MKIKFRGWGREVYAHDHAAAPVSMRNGRYSSGKSGDPIEWESGTRGLAKLTRLGLTGNFLLDMEFEPAELRSWLTHYVKQEPEAAAHLLGEMQGMVMVALAHKAKADAVTEASWKSKKS